MTLLCAGWPPSRICSGLAAMAKLRRLIDHAATTPTDRGGTEPHADEFAWLMDENTAVTQIDGV